MKVYIEEIFQEKLGYIFGPGLTPHFLEINQSSDTLYLFIDSDLYLKKGISIPVTPSISHIYIMLDANLYRIERAISKTNNNYTPEQWYRHVLSMIVTLMAIDILKFSRNYSIPPITIHKQDIISYAFKDMLDENKSVFDVTEHLLSLVIDNLIKDLITPERAKEQVIGAFEDSLYVKTDNKHLAQYHQTDEEYHRHHHLYPTQEESI